MINRMLSRALSLLLAVVFLLGAGWLSFYLFFEGVGVYADSGVAITLKEVKQDGRPVTRLSGGMRGLALTFQVTGASSYQNLEVDFAANGGFTSNNKSATASAVQTVNGKYSFQFTVSDCAYDGRASEATFTLYKNDPAEYTVNLSGWLGGDGDSYSLQSYLFYGSDGNPLTRLRKGTNISRLVFTVKDNGISQQAYNAAKKSDFSATLNYATFSKNNKTLPQFSGTATPLSDGSISYTLTFYDLRYTGKTDRLELKIGYPQSFGLERRLFSETLTEGELYVPSTPDKDDESSSSEVEIAPPTPNIIISAYDYGGGSPTAASNVMLDVSFANTSDKLTIENIVMKVAMPEAFTLTNSSNTFYITSMPKGAEETRSVGFSVKPNAEAISHPIKIAFTFEAVIKNERKQFTSEQEISIPVSQLNRVTLNPVEVPMEIYIEPGNSFGFEATFVNKGKSTIYNVSASIEGENLAQAGQPQFIGNMESGKQSSADFLLEALAPGPVTGEVVLVYEDSNMNISELRTPFQTQAIQMDMGPPPGMQDGTLPEDMPVTANAWYKAVPVWTWMVAGVALLIAIAFTVKTVRSIRQKKLEAEDEDF